MFVAIAELVDNAVDEVSFFWNPFVFYSYIHSHMLAQTERYVHTHAHL